MSAPLIISATFGKKNFNFMRGLTQSPMQLGMSLGGLMLAFTYDMTGSYRVWLDSLYWTNDTFGGVLCLCVSDVKKGAVIMIILFVMAVYIAFSIFIRREWKLR